MNRSVLHFPASCAWDRYPVTVILSLFIFWQSQSSGVISTDLFELVLDVFLVWTYQDKGILPQSPECDPKPMNALTNSLPVIHSSAACLYCLIGHAPHWGLH